MSISENLSDTYSDDSGSTGHTDLGKEAWWGSRSGKDVLLVHNTHRRKFLNFYSEVCELILEFLCLYLRKVRD